MKSLLVSASTLAIAIATPASAADDMFAPEYFQPNKAGGYLDLHYGLVGGFYDTFGGDSEWSWRTVGLHGRANLPIPNSKMNVQIDGTADSLFVAGKGSSVGLSTPIEFTAHLYGRDPQSHALGVLASAGTVGGLGIWGIGVEGQHFFNRFTLYGQAGYRTLIAPSAPSNLNELYLRGIGRYFATDNVRLEGELGFARITGPGPSVGNVFWVATAEHRFGQFPLGVYAQYRGNGYSGDITGTTHEFRVGLRGHMGTNSLFDNDRHAASFDTRAPDPFFYGKISVGP